MCMIKKNDNVIFPFFYSTTCVTDPRPLLITTTWSNSAVSLCLFILAHVAQSAEARYIIKKIHVCFWFPDRPYFLPIPQPPQVSFCKCIAKVVLTGPNFTTYIGPCNTVPKKFPIISSIKTFYKIKTFSYPLTYLNFLRRWNQKHT